MEEERIRQLKEDKDDVTKKSDLSDFYFNLGKNVAFGAKDVETRKREKQEKQYTEGLAGTSNSDYPSRDPKSDMQLSELKEANQDEDSSSPLPTERNLECLDKKPVVDEQVLPATIQAVTPSEQPKNVHHKRNEDAVAAVKERFMARKKEKLLF